MPIEIKNLEIRGVVQGNNNNMHTKEILKSDDLIKLKSDII